jgi:hypothetical protein
MGALPGIRLRIGSRRELGPGARRRRPHLLAALIYLDLSLSLFGARVIAHPATSYLGFLKDPGFFIWCLEWWPWSILHGHNPFYSHLVWAPTGFDLTWTTSVPGLCLLAAPITLIFGPVVSYNILALAGPALSAWTAYVLCDYIVGSFWPSLFGGWVFGFSTYEVNHVLVGHLCLSWVAIPPLSVLLILRLVEGSIASRRFVIYFAATLVLQFSISQEIFATMTMFGTATLLMAAWTIPGARLSLRRSIVPIGCAFLITATLVSPLLYYFFLVHGVPREPIYPPVFFSTDLLSAIVPGPLTFLSRAVLSGPGAWENGAYFGPALVAVILSFALQNWAEPVTKLLLAALLIVFVASLGPELHVANHPTVPMPWHVIGSHFRLLNNALPARFILFAWLIVAVIAAGWLKMTDDIAVGVRIGVAVLSIVFLFPHPSFLLSAATPIDVPPFFARGLYRQYLRPGENILLIPYSHEGDGMLWQAQTGMKFRMAGGWTGAAPSEFLEWPIVSTLFTSIPTPEYGEQLKAFVARQGIEKVVVSNAARRPWSALLASLGVEPLEVGGITLYNVPSQIRRSYGNADAGELEHVANDAWFAQLLRGADRYISLGFDLAELCPDRAVRLGLLPDAVWPESLEAVLIGRRIGGPMLWIGPWSGNTVAVALAGPPASLERLVQRYRADAHTVYFPYPDNSAAGTPEILLMVFQREGLARAARRVSTDTAMPMSVALDNPGFHK